MILMPFLNVGARRDANKKIVDLGEQEMSWQDDQNRHQYLKFVINTFLVSNIRHQHRCNPSNLIE